MLHLSPLPNLNLILKCQEICAKGFEKLKANKIRNCLYQRGALYPVPDTIPYLEIAGKVYTCARVNAVSTYSKRKMISSILSHQGVKQSKTPFVTTEKDRKNTIVAIQSLSKLISSSPFEQCASGLNKTLQNVKEIAKLKEKYVEKQKFKADRKIAQVAEENSQQEKSINSIDFSAALSLTQKGVLKELKSCEINIPVQAYLPVGTIADLKKQIAKNKKCNKLKSSFKDSEVAKAWVQKISTSVQDTKTRVTMLSRALEGELPNIERKLLRTTQKEREEILEYGLRCYDYELKNQIVNAYGSCSQGSQSPKCIL